MKKLCLKLGHKDPEHLARMHRLRLGCLVCGRQTGVHFHHCLHGRYSTEKQTDHGGIMLCSEHHAMLHGCGKGGAEFFYLMFLKGYLNNIQKQREWSRNFRKGSDLTYALRQASLIFALQCYSMTDLEMIQAYREIQGKNKLLFKDRLFRTNITRDLDILKSYVKL